MALTESMLVPWISAVPRKCRLFLVVFLVRIWRLNACERLMLPLPRTRKRFFATLLVFIFGMTSSLICCPLRCSPAERLLDRLRASLADWGLLLTAYLLVASARLSPLPSWGPAASPSAGLRALATTRLHCTVQDHCGSARASALRTPGAPFRD